jgi:hypothetical protein
MAIALQPGKNCLFVVCARDTTGGTVASKFYVINILCDGSSGGAAASGGGGLTDDEVAVAAGFSAVLGTASLLGLIQIARWAFNHFGAKSKTEAAAHTGTSSLARCFRYPGARRRSGDEEEEEVVVARSGAGRDVHLTCARRRRCRGRRRRPMPLLRRPNPTRALTRRHSLKKPILNTLAGVKGLTSSSVGGKTPHTPKTPTAPKPASPPRSPPRERNFVRVNMADDLNPAASHFSVAPHTGL